jgi:hypothetical protein
VGRSRAYGLGLSARTVFRNKNSPEKCLVDLERDTGTSIDSHRYVGRKDAIWGLNCPSRANLLARMQLKRTFMCL